MSVLPSPLVLVVMGVSGSGKSTVAAMLAGRLGWAFGDGDDFHPPANVAKMRGGTPLTDDDRWPWLRAIAAWVDASRAAGRPGVVACSALRRAYRDVVLAGRPDVRLVFLHGDVALISRRQSARAHHYMPAGLVSSQFEALEPPAPDEDALAVSVEAGPREIVDAIVARLGVSAPRLIGRTATRDRVRDTGTGMTDQDEMKRQAAEAAVAEVESGMVLGLGTGSTAALAVEALAARVRAGLRVVGVPTSERTAAQAASLGIPLARLGERPRLDLTIDGADEVHRGTLDLVKGLGGALLREKIVAASGRRMTVIVDEGKLVDALGARVRLPVEVVRFGWQATLERLRDAGADPVLRGGPDEPFVTDGGNHIADCRFPDIPDPAALHARLKALVGVVETGLFIGMATRVIVGTPSGPRVLERA